MSQTGTSGDDTLNGGSAADLIRLLNGNDRSFGRGGNDTLDGGSGADTLNGETGADSISGGNQDDQLIGHHDNDTILGGAGNDMLDGGYDNDRLSGGLGNDTLYGSYGRDRLDGGDGDDVLNGGLGSGPSDTLLGGAGNDRVFGSGGDDVIDGGFGADDLRGSSGADRFVFDEGHSGTGGLGRDTLVSASYADGDRVDLRSIDANTALAGDQAFTFMGSTKDGATFTGAGQVLIQAYNTAGVLIQGPGSNVATAYYVIALNTGGSLAPEMEITATHGEGANSVTWTAGWFLL